jgi:hypothetical protein
LNKRLFALFACLVPFALIAAGCGSSDNNESTTTAALTKAEFLKKGNAICAKGNKELNKKFAAYDKTLKRGQEPSDAQKKELAETILFPTIRKEISGVGALPAPEGEEEKVEEIVDTAQEALEKAEEDPVAFVSEEESPVFAKADKLTREYGLTACGEEEEEKKS